MKALGETDSPIASREYLSDGTGNLALLRYETADGAGKERGKNCIRAHQVGFWCDDLNAQTRTVEKNGGPSFSICRWKRNPSYEKKYRDPDGIIFDISHNGWAGTVK